MHSTDLQYGVPWEFNAILDDLLDGGNGNEEEYKMQMNLSMSAIPQTPGGNMAPEEDP